MSDAVRRYGRSRSEIRTNYVGLGRKWGLGAPRAPALVRGREAAAEHSSSVN
jgi:hypothetical protein